MLRALVRKWDTPLSQINSSNNTKVRGPLSGGRGSYCPCATPRLSRIPSLFLPHSSFLLCHSRPSSNTITHFAHHLARGCLPTHTSACSRLFARFTGTASGSKAENNPAFFLYLNPRQQPPVKMSSSDDDVPLVKGRANGGEFSHYISAFRKVDCFTRKHCPRCSFGPIVPMVLLKFHPSPTSLYHHQTSPHFLHFLHLLTLLPTCSEVARPNTQKRRQSHGQRETLKRPRRPWCFHSHGSCGGDGRGHATCKRPHEWEAEGSKQYHEWQGLQGSKQFRGR